MCGNASRPPRLSTSPGQTTIYCVRVVYEGLREESRDREGDPGNPRHPTCNALAFSEEARWCSIYWLASWLAQNSHL